MSKRFTFRLDGLHKYRRHKTNEAKLALGQIAQLRFEKMEAIVERREYLQSLSQERKTARASELQMHSAHVDSIRQEIKALEAELVNLEEIEAQRRSELSHKMRDEK